jgi:hypothetical protein
MKQTNKVMSAILFLILLVGLCGTVSAVNVYQTITPFKSETGHLYVTVLCHHNLFSKEMVLVNNDLAPDVNISVFLRPDGTFDERFISGNYTLTLLDGNAGHKEVRNFFIRNGYEQYVIFIGHAVTFEHIKKNVTPEPTPTPTETPIVTPTITPNVTPTVTPTPIPTQCVPVVNILSALYGAKGVCHEVINVSEHNETVIDVPAHFEHQISTYELITPGVKAYTEKYGNYTLTRRGESHNWYADFVGAGNGKYNVVSTDGCGGYKRDGNSDNYKLVKDGKCGNFNVIDAFIYHPSVPAVYGFVVTTPFTDGSCPLLISCIPHIGDTKCEERFVEDTFKEITVPTTYKTVCDADNLIDVTANVQSVVDGGDLSFSFNNAPNPGGIFATNGTLLNQITDPVYGTVKTATITYSVSCGGIQNGQVSGAEGVILTLDTSVPA